jgi:hypothetical protein
MLSILFFIQWLIIIKTIKGFKERRKVNQWLILLLHDQHEKKKLRGSKSIETPALSQTFSAALLMHNFSHLMRKL